MANAGLAGFGSALENLGMILAQHYTSEAARKREEERYQSEMRLRQQERSEDIARAREQEETRLREMRIGQVLPFLDTIEGQVAPKAVQELAPYSPLIAARIQTPESPVPGLGPAPFGEFKIDPVSQLPTAQAQPTSPFIRKTRISEAYEAEKALRDLQTRVQESALESARREAAAAARRQAVLDTHGSTPFRQLLTQPNTPMSLIEAYPQLGQGIISLIEGAANRGVQGAQNSWTRALTMVTMADNLYNEAYAPKAKEISDAYDKQVEAAGMDYARIAALTAQRDQQLANARELAQRAATAGIEKITKGMSAFGQGMPPGIEKILGFPQGLTSGEAMTQYQKSRIDPLRIKLTQAGLGPNVMSAFEAATQRALGDPEFEKAAAALEYFVNQTLMTGQSQFTGGGPGIVQAPQTPTAPQGRGGVRGAIGGGLSSGADYITNFLKGLDTSPTPAPQPQRTPTAEDILRQLRALQLQRPTRSGGGF